MTEEMAEVDSSDVLFKIRQDSHNFHTSISCSAVGDISPFVTGQNDRNGHHRLRHRAAWRVGAVIRCTYVLLPNPERIVTPEV